MFYFNEYTFRNQRKTDYFISNSIMSKISIKYCAILAAAAFNDNNPRKYDISILPVTVS